jgi:hypothetical protein
LSPPLPDFPALPGSTGFAATAFVTGPAGAAGAPDTGLAADAGIGPAEGATGLVTTAAPAAFALPALAAGLDAGFAATVFGEAAEGLGELLPLWFVETVLCVAAFITRAMSGLSFPCQ